MTPTYSVVVPVYNEELALIPCLTALTTQTTKEPYEVIVVDNNSTDTSAAVAKQFSDRLNLRVVHERTQGRGMARKAGFEAARGDIILSTDADAAVPPNWIEVLTAPLRDPEVVGTTAFCYINDCTPFTNARFNIVQPAASLGYRLFFHHYWLSGFSFAVRKDIYTKSGGFDGTLDAQEDTDLSKRVSKLGKIVVVRDTKILVSGRRFKNGLSRGLYPYVKTYFDRNFLRKKSTYLSNVRD